ncbi:hypothetical protein [Leekyejoonella antrihumi]|uniref:hypothetical protein n=1 Tax=Leekyejoonella antrihumi TaxID=1660198 RepID=UPI0016486D62|nr:hypothetical protein [Leekyejoonella antrihumi]
MIERVLRAPGIPHGSAGRWAMAGLVSSCRITSAVAGASGLMSGGSGLPADIIAET